MGRMQQTAKRLGEIHNDLERAVFLAVYDSREQRRRRFLALLALTTKHALRGLLFSWPLYLMAMGALYVPRWQAAALLVLAIPGIGLSFYILVRAVCEDYRGKVEGLILGTGYLSGVTLGRAS